MKKLFISAALIAALKTAGASPANIITYRDDSKNISLYVLNQFNDDFTGARSVVWTITSTSQKAEFVLNGKKKIAYYDLTSNYLGLTEEIDYVELPAKALKEIEDKYHGYQAGQIVKFTPAGASSVYVNEALTPSDNVVYFADFKSTDHELILRVTGPGSVYLHKTIK